MLTIIDIIPHIGRARRNLKQGERVLRSRFAQPDLKVLHVITRMYHLLLLAIAYTILY